MSIKITVPAKLTCDKCYAEWERDIEVTLHFQENRVVSDVHIHKLGGVGGVLHAIWLPELLNTATVCEPCWDGIHALDAERGHHNGNPLDKTP